MMIATQNGQRPDNRYPDPLEVYRDDYKTVTDAAEFLNISEWSLRDMLKWSREDGRPAGGSEFPNAYQQRPPTSLKAASTSPIRIPMFDIWNYIMRVTQGLTFNDLHEQGLYIHPGTDEKEAREKLAHAV